MADEKLFRLMLDNSLGGSSASSGQKQLYIMDARPRANAYANAAKGGGIENLQGYPQCKFEYLGIPNIHVIRESCVVPTTTCAQACKRLLTLWARYSCFFSVAQSKQAEQRLRDGCRRV
jgi:hypothetical protein